MRSVAETEGRIQARLIEMVQKLGRAVAAGEVMPEAQKTGYTVNGHFNNMVGSLRSLGVIDYPQGGGVTLGRMFDALA